MDHKIKVSAVSYLNTKPLLYGIERHPVINAIHLTLEYPALIAQHLQDGTADMGLVPVAAMSLIPNARIVSNYGIAADGKVASVCIFSKVPMAQVARVYLDYQSRTSVRLARILLKHYWGKQVTLLPAPENFIDLIDGTTAGVVIGDRALVHQDEFPYVYDLAEHWKLFTGLPFVFAAWVANKELPESFLREFDAANAQGLEHIPEVIAATPYAPYDLKTYYEQNIHYILDAEKLKGLALFQQYLKEPGIGG